MHNNLRLIKNVEMFLPVVLCFKIWINKNTAIVYLMNLTKVLIKFEKKASEIF